MSGFTALNIEPEQNVEEDIDDTKELQIEEAFKLYQNALKLHSQGPQYFHDAKDAYDELLKSEVFKYPEGLSDFAHDELAESHEPTTAILQPDAATLELMPGAAAETSASSLAQLIYLSFKSRGQFNLDAARHHLPDRKAPRQDLCRYYADSCKASVQDFAKALERDDTDLDLWKKAARIAEVVSSQRISRFCLESVLAGDDDDEQTIDLSGLDEALAAGDIEEIMDLLQDDLSRLRSSDVKPRDALLEALRKTNDPYSFLPKPPSTLEYTDDRRRPLSFGIASVSLRLASNDMSTLAQALLQTVMDAESGTLSSGGATKVQIELPRISQDPKSISPVTASEKSVEDSSHRTFLPGDQTQTTKGDIVKDADMTESPIVQSTENAADGNEQPMTTIDDDAKKDSEAQHADTQTGDGSDRLSRKRSATTAGNEEHEGRAKSKRLRARESLADQAALEEDPAYEDPHQAQEALALYENADNAMFDVMNSMLVKLDLKTYYTSEEAMQAFWNSSDIKLSEATGHLDGDSRLLTDLRQALINWSDQKSQAIIHGHGNQDFVEKSTGMSLFLQHSKATVSADNGPPSGFNHADLPSLVSEINTNATTVFDAALYLISSMLTAQRGASNSSYMSESWPLEMKQTVVQLAVTADSSIYESLRQAYNSLVSPSADEKDLANVKPLLELIQGIFEIHLDVYAAITNPSSTTEETKRTLQGDRLSRWASLADDMTKAYLDVSPSEAIDPLLLRFIWASMTYANMAEGVDKSHVLLCLQDLRTLLERNELPPVVLPNNAAMPVISVSAIDQEVSRLSTLDFFTSVFDSDNSDPVAVIESLEPILEQPHADGAESASSPASSVSHHSSQVEQLIKFLESGDAALTLFLWRRLQNAYTAISYPPKVVSCLLRAIETSVNELYTSRHLGTETIARQISTLKWLRDVDELMIKALSKILSDPNAFECIAESHLRTSMIAVTRLARLLHGFVLFDDSLRVKQVPEPPLKGAAAAKLFEKSKDRFREMLVRTMTLLYLLLKEATVQNPANFDRAADDLAEYLSTVHHMLGVRHYCRYSNKSFVRLVKSELGTLSVKQDYSADLTQVFYDLYQLRFVSGLGDADHGCPSENMDKKTAWSLIPTIMKYTEKFNIRDLIKNELKGSIDKVQSALGTTKSTPAMLYNKRLVSSYLKSPINPTELYRCLRGIGDLPTRRVQSETQAAGDSSWYFLQGYITLAKYKSIKRINPTPTDDLDTAASFFRQDLEYGIDKWETWYRLAQVYEAKIEDDLIWNSNKVNDNRADIAVLERQAIHSYTMAIAMAMRYADDQLETARKIEDLYAELATRLYASSRPPLSMEAFKTDKLIRHLSSMVDGSMSKQSLYKPIKEYALWKFAAHLLSIKLTDRPKPWTNHYTRGKCLWKMFQKNENFSKKRPVTVEQILEAFTDAIEALPKKERSNEYILEPHFKLVSIVHKMVRRGVISLSQAMEALQSTRYTNGVRLSEGDEDAAWERYILDVLKKLSSADKSNWHHRIIDRAAHVIYDDSRDTAGALGAKHQFTQQIFTKTMTMQVWKPEHERPGRHYVYMNRYVAFFVHLLEQLNDRASLDQLVRRIRRKTTDFLDHTKVWEECATTYVRMLRRHGSVPDGRERQLFDGMNFDEFTRKSEKLEAWAHDPDNESVFLEVMRDAIDLKRINNSLMKGPIIDELIGDSYACLYEQFVAQLPVEEQPKPAPTLPTGTFINMTADLASGDEDAQRARLNDVLRTQGDGAAEGPLAVSISAPGGVDLGVQNPAVVPAEAPRERNKPGRTKTVTRREVQRKAEAAIVKPPPIKTPILSKRPTLELNLGKADVESAMNSPTIRPEDEKKSAASSRRPSVQESAAEDSDDDSELSELEDLDDEKKEIIKQKEREERGEADNPPAHEGDDDGDDEAEDEDGDEEMVDAEEGDENEGDGDVEIPDSQDARDRDREASEDVEFHEAREE